MHFWLRAYALRDEKGLDGLGPYDLFRLVVMHVASFIFL
jgi:hypothetical protein